VELETMLTDKQERFAQLVFQGYDQSEAKRLAYPECKLTGNALYVNASRLANLAKVRLRVDKLRNAAVTPLIADITERKSHASTIMRDNKARHRDQLAANKLIGDYEGDFVQKVESRSLSVELRAELGQFTIEELRIMLKETRGE
jgi:hypothetical protein